MEIAVSSVSSITRSVKTMETIIFYFRKPTKASREHELHGQARKLRVALISIGSLSSNDGNGNGNENVT